MKVTCDIRTFAKRWCVLSRSNSTRVGGARLTGGRRASGAARASPRQQRPPPAPRAPLHSVRPPSGRAVGRAAALTSAEPPDASPYLARTHSPVTSA
ncbi:hypothetical protein B5X24_HaOG208094 [Helicoverpa armigera]|nr:hypothetical protein B5X24_HaOG208094 [Helicoverpa armigera]